MSTELRMSGTKVMARRKKLGWSVNDAVAEMHSRYGFSNVSRTSWLQWEQNTQPRADYFGAIAGTLGVKMEDLMERVEV